MFSVLQEPVPASSLLRTCRQGPDPAAWDHFSDCFSTTVIQPVTLAEFVFAFYTSPVFRMERAILGWFDWPSTDAEARDLAEGRRDRFAAWRVAERTETQLLVGDALGHTRSWFCITPDDGAGGTRLQFGSGIAAIRDPATGQQRQSLGFRLLGGFHVLYSQVLLSAAASHLKPR
ncbi:MAG: hypothetical protein ABIX37_08145 [Gammaproteobacteria bacterium]